MKILIDINGKVGFEDWFDRSDLDKLKEGLSSQGIPITTEEVDYEFKQVPVLKKKDRFAKIPMTAKNIFIMLSNADKDNDSILKLLGITRESGFIITTLIRTLQGEYVKWEKIDNSRTWANDEERMKAFARYFESRAARSNRQIARIIETMEEAGCRRNEEERFPECDDEFNMECTKCCFGKDFIRTQEDVDRFNEENSRE